MDLIKGKNKKSSKMSLKKRLSNAKKITAPLIASATLLLSPNAKAEEEHVQDSIRQEETFKKIKTALTLRKKLQKKLKPY